MYDILFTFTSAKSEDSTAMLMASVNATLTAAVSSVDGGASPFSAMLTLQFLNVSSAAGSIDANVFSGVTTPAPTVLAAVVTATTQAPISAPTAAPTTEPVQLSASSQSSQLVIGLAVGLSAVFLMITSVIIILYRRSRCAL